MFLEVVQDILFDTKENYVNPVSQNRRHDVGRAGFYIRSKRTEPDTQ